MSDRVRELRLVKAMAGAVERTLEDAKTMAAVDGVSVVEALGIFRDDWTQRGKPSRVDIVERTLALVALDKSLDDDPGIGLCL